MVQQADKLYGEFKSDGAKDGDEGQEEDGAEMSIAAALKAEIAELNESGKAENAASKKRFWHLNTSAKVLDLVNSVSSVCAS